MVGKRVKHGSGKFTITEWEWGQRAVTVSVEPENADLVKLLKNVADNRSPLLYYPASGEFAVAKIPEGQKLTHE